MKKIRKYLIKLLIGKNNDRHKLSFDGNNIINSLNDNYLFDFRNYAADTFGNHSYINGNDESLPESDGDLEIHEPRKKLKIRIKPIDVLHELETIPTPFNLHMIDEKVSMLKDKSNLITQDYAKREVNALIERLENRKKYDKYRSYYDHFQNTTDEKNFGITYQI